MIKFITCPPRLKSKLGLKSRTSSIASVAETADSAGCPPPDTPSPPYSGAKRRWRSSDIIARSSYIITWRPITQSVLLKTTGSTDAGSFRIKRNAPILGFHDAVARPWSETAISAASRPTILSIRIFPSVLSGARPIVMASLVFTKLDDENSTRSSFGPIGAAAAIARILHVGQKFEDRAKIGQRSKME